MASNVNPALETDKPQSDSAPRSGGALSLLVVGRNGDGHIQVQDMLQAPGAPLKVLHSVSSLADAARAAQTHAYDAVLLDMDDKDGGYAPKSIAAINELLGDIPLIIFSSDDRESTAIEALGLGAQDYLIKGIADGPAIVRAVRYAMERKRTEQRLQTLLNYDNLTQLPNRELLLDRLTQAIAQATRQQTLVGLLLLDLDRFKLVNDTLGHAFGDKILQDVAQRIAGCIRDSDTVARLGGDEFVVVLSNIKGVEDAAKVANKIINQLSAPIQIDGHEVFATASIGISIFPNDGVDKNALITNADVAMYRAKEEGRNHFQFYTYDMNAATGERLKIESDLRRAVERDELLLFYQPQVSIDGLKLVGVEALVRWQHPDLGLVPPARFIPIAEETGLIVPVGEWVIKEACRQARAWQDAGVPPMKVSVNLSSRQFHQENMLKTVTEALEESNLSAQWLALEITESSLMHDPDDAVVTLCLLHNMGITISIDDFGTGYSSLNHLKRFPLDSLKIDRAFVDEVTENSEDAAIVRAILAMAHSLHLKVVAEGVETKEQLDFLEKAGCDEVQGYYLAKPLPADQLAKDWLKLETA